MNGGGSENHYDFHTGMFSSYQQPLSDKSRNAPTALMIDPGLTHTQNQDTGHTQQSDITEAVQAQKPLQPASGEVLRSLPATNIDNETVDEAYVQFIFYCNPSVPLNTDTTELKRGFRSMPKTDGNCFDTFALYQLIKKLEAKEIETWSQLVIELGVEPPDTAKNQSSQKVQQFAVRLKRWLHAFHIDAFFQYCLGRPTPYSTEVPPAEESPNETVRDGVPPEEDLALRALLPEWRPKRGRRKLESSDSTHGTPSKRARREGSLNAEDTATPLEVQSALLRSALSWGQQPRFEQFRPDDPWGAAQRALLPKSDSSSQAQLRDGQHAFWVDLPDATPSTPYPQSAVTPRHPQSAIASRDDPQSAHPLSSGRIRKRHGPAVSAAWPSSSNTAAGKLPRGRPPNNRSVQDGPFSTFPVNSQIKTPIQPSADTPTQSTRAHPWILYTAISSSLTNQSTPAPATSVPGAHTPVKKPSKLSLQVPQHAGGPVRLATPPPKVLVNGEDGGSVPTSSQAYERRSSADYFNAIDEEASELGDVSEEEGERVDWKRRATLLKRKLRDKEAELKAMRRRVMEAVIPANIPLRNLIPPPRFSDEHSASLLESANEKQAPRRSTDSLGSDYSFFSDTGDLAEQLAAEADPLHVPFRSSLEEGSASTSRTRHRERHSRKVHYVEQDHLERKITNPGVDKEAIQIPQPKARYITRAEKVVAVLMTGDRESSQMHGLTGKPLLYFTSVFVSLGVFLFGYDQGVMSGIITGAYFKDYFNQPTFAEIGTMVAILEVGAFISSLLVGRIGDIIGRRRTILYGSIIFFTGGALQSFANGMPMMIVGRIIAGLGVGALSTIVPIYQSEISPPHNRGKLACIEFTGNVAGYAASVWVDYFCTFIENDYSWRVPLALQCFMGALLGLGSLIICESPRWLLDNDHDEEGIVVIANLYGGGDIHNDKARQEYREIKMDVLLQRQEGEKSYRDMFRKYYKRVFIAMSAQALAQLNGINVISYYAPLVFESAGWYGRNAILMTGINAITYLLSTVPPWYVVDRWGRRIILMSGAIAMVISLSLISYFLFIDIHYTPTLVVIFVMIYNASFGASWGPIPWLYPPEILPLSIRAKGASLSTATNWAFNWLVGEVTPVLQDLIKWRLYLIHAFFCAVSFVLVYFIYPETANLRLEDMDQLFGDATTAMPTPAQHAEIESLMSGNRSPVPSLDIRRGRPGNFTADNAIPGLDINPPIDGENGKSQLADGNDDRRQSEGIGGWISRMVNRSKSDDKGAGGEAGLYRRLGQDDD
ncbi:hypothetical protein MMC11_002762 [Xylographa trunciseda]|nr:hypothetical protein [Xylographa trunciseda]